MGTFAVVVYLMVILFPACRITARNCSSTETLKCFRGKCSCVEGLRGHTSVNNESFSCLAPICNCTRNGHLHIAARCKSVSLRVQHAISHPEKVLSLDLSESGAAIVSKNVFTGFSNLINLSLARNKIRFIEENGFRGLDSLHFLSGCVTWTVSDDNGKLNRCFYFVRDLSLNDILWWEGNIIDEIPSLQLIDLTNNKQWQPNRQLLELRMLKEIRGVTWSRGCENCSLTKNFTDDTVKLSKGDYVIHGGWCRGLKYSVGKETKEYASYNFTSQCLYRSKTCYNSEIQVTKIHRCWDTDNDVLNSIYVFGSFDVFLNSIVVLLTLSSKCLRENVTMLFIANLALSDILVGIYGLGIAISRRVLTYSEFESKVLGSLCLFLGFIWVVGEFMTIVTSFLLTFERYIVILYGLVPNRRINCKKAIVYLAVSWISAVVVAVLPLVGIGSYSTNTFCLPIQPSRKVTSIFFYSVGITLLGVVLYILTIPLYIRIFIYVRNSGSQVGIKRDGVLARRIAVLVFSNMVFFFFPTIIGLLWMLTPALKNLSVITREVLVGPLPVVLYTVNSFLNPLLYAYRNNRFRQVLRHKVTPREDRSLSFEDTSRATKKSFGSERTNTFINLTPLQ